MSSYEYADRLKETVKNYPIFFLSKSCIINDAGEKYFPPKTTARTHIALPIAHFPGFYGLPDVSKENLLYHTGINTEKLFEVLVKQISAGLLFQKIPIIQTAI